MGWPLDPYAPPPEPMISQCRAHGLIDPDTVEDTVVQRPQRLRTVAIGLDEDTFSAEDMHTLIRVLRSAAKYRAEYHEATFIDALRNAASKMGIVDGE